MESPSTSYRWTLFPWLADQCRVEKVKTLLVLGDVTDSKDQHNAELVNHVVREFDKLRAAVPRIVILMGNHDFLRDGNMFFKFLDALPGIEVVTSPSEDKDIKGESTFFLPYSKNPVKDWDGLDFSHYRYMFMHQTVKGARSSNGQEMEGETLPPLNAAKVYSGDIHVPQIIGAVEYVGSPYHVHFGDSFKPRCVLLERDGNAVDLFMKSPRRITMKVKSLEELKATALHETRAGDQVKLRLGLDEADRHDWKRIKRQAIDFLVAHDVDVHAVELVAGASGEVGDLMHAARRSVDPAESLRRFVAVEELGGDAYDAGMDILETR